MPRYEIGQVVRVRSLIASPHVGKSGIVVAVKPNNRDKPTLDKYVLEFDGDEREEFWDIQLEMELSGLNRLKRLRWG